MTATNRLLPMGTLKRACLRQLFRGWVTKLVGQGRLATLKLSSDVAKQLRKRFQLGPVENPGAEAKALQRFLKLARKRKLSAKSAKAAMSSMDNLDTLQMEDHTLEPLEDRLLSAIAFLGCRLCLVLDMLYKVGT